MELLRTLSYVMADAGIIAWMNKYAYNVWRPITAIAGGAYNSFRTAFPKLPYDPTWVPLVLTPAFPEYGSGHSQFSGAASAVFTQYFGALTPFTISNAGITRSFPSFSAAAIEAGKSRIWGGFHFEFSNTRFVELAKTVGQEVMANLGVTHA